MPKVTDIGNEVFEVPFGDFISNVAQGIARGQQALDLTSVQTLIELSQTMVDLIPEVTEVLTPEPIKVNVSGGPSVEVTGARVTATPSPPVSMSALQAGITPTFYQFAETTIVLKMSVQLREVQETDTDGTQRRGILAFGSNVNFRTQNTFTYSVDASSSVTAILKPVPPPSRVVPTVITVNALGKTPVVTVSP
jgi:hypothetical protein